MKICDEIENHFEKIYKYFDSDSIVVFLSSGYSSICKFNLTVGEKIREDLLQDESELYLLFCSGGIIEKEDMSELMLRLFYIHSIGEYYLR